MSYGLSFISYYVALSVGMYYHVLLVFACFTMSAGDCGFFLSPVLQIYDESGLVRFLTMVIYYYQHPLAILLMKETVFSNHLHIAAILVYRAHNRAYILITHLRNVGLSRS